MSKVFCLVGGSGVGKDTVKNILPLPHVVSYRTRPIRDGEEDGKDGYFVTKGQYLHALENGQIAAETLYNGHYYWTEKQQFNYFLDAKIPVLYVVDGAGVKSLRMTLGFDKVYAIWLDADIDTLKSRMRRRGDTFVDIEERIEFFKKIADHDRSLCDFSIMCTNKSPERIAQMVSFQILRVLYGKR